MPLLGLIRVFVSAAGNEKIIDAGMHQVCGKSRAAAHRSDSLFCLSDVPIGLKKIEDRLYLVYRLKGPAYAHCVPAVELFESF